MRRIDIPAEACLLHGLRFSGYIEAVTEVFATGDMVVDSSSNPIYTRPYNATEIALDEEYFQIFAEFYEQGGDLALSEPDELLYLISRVCEFYKQNDLCNHPDIIARWNNAWRSCVNYRFFTDNHAPELRLEYKDSGYTWRVGRKRKTLYRWSSREFVKCLDISVCPYCNLNPLPMDSIRKGKAVYHMHPDMDHYFDKKRHPFLSLNIYNLIPSCDICNRRIKESRQIDYFHMAHPYVNDVHDLVVVKANENVIANPYIDNVSDDWLSKDARGDSEDTGRGLRWFDFFGIMDLCKNQITKQKLLCAVKNAAVKENLRQLYRKQYGQSMTVKQFEEQCYGCSLNPNEINKQPLSKITIDLVAQVEKLKRLGRSVLRQNRIDEGGS